jgi:hypothetical protein
VITFEKRTVLDFPGYQSKRVSTLISAGVCALRAPDVHGAAASKSPANPKRNDLALPMQC